MGVGVSTVTTGTSFTLGQADILVAPIYINPTANIVVTLPTSLEGGGQWIWHVGTGFTITVNFPDATTLIILAAGERCYLQTYLDTSNVPQWATSVFAL